MESKHIVRKVLKSDPYRYTVPLDTSKDRRRCIERIKKHARQSMEYRDYIYFLKTFADFDKCSFFQSLSSSNPVSKSKIECHHGPLTIDDVIDVVLQKWIDSGMEINELIIAEEVMDLHYRNLIGLTPLSKTVHQAITNSDKFDVPIHMYYGQWEKFLNMYGDSVDDKYFDKIETAINKTKEMTEDDFKALIVQFEYLEIEGQSDAEKIENEPEGMTGAA